MKCSTYASFQLAEIFKNPLNYIISGNMCVKNTKTHAEHLQKLTTTLKKKLTNINKSGTNK